MYYNAGWQLIEADIYEGWSSGSPGTVDQRRAWFWGARYIDDAVEMLVDDDNDGDYWFGPLEAVGDFYYFFLHDAQFSTVAVLDDAANLEERISYDAYGRARHHDWRDNDGDGDYDSTDRPFIPTPSGYAITHANYSVDFDLDRDGDMDTTDLTIGGTSYPTPLTRGELSYSAIGNIIGYDGYLFDREMEQYTVRHRHYDPVLGRWLERDPAGYVDGMNRLSVGSGSPLAGSDPRGLDFFKDATGANWGSFSGSLGPLATPGWREVGSTLILSFDHNQTSFANACCTEVRFIQAYFYQIDPITAGFWDRRANDRWAVDADGNTTPTIYYPFDKPRDPHGRVSSTMTDEPHIRIWAQKMETSGYAMRFETCAVCSKGDDEGSIYGCIRWGHIFKFRRTWGITRLPPTATHRWVNEAFVTGGAIVSTFTSPEAKGWVTAGGQLNFSGVPVRSPSAGMLELFNSEYRWRKGYEEWLQDEDRIDPRG